MQMSWRPLSEQPGLSYTWAVPQTDRLHAARIDAVIHEKGGQPSIECIEMHTFQKPDTSV